MHKIELPQDVIERIEERRGRLNMFEDLDPARTALLVVDMQNGFVAEGSPSEVPVARDIVPNINRLANATREAGGTVVWITTMFTPEVIEAWSVFFDYFYRPEGKKAMETAMNEGGISHALWHELKPQDGDWEVNKDRFSAFIHGASDIEVRLRDADIDTVIITGTVTSVCCESTARDAMMRNFKVVFVTDANAGRSDADHNASLSALAQVFADIQSTDQVIANLKIESKSLLPRIIST